ncbi:hypothetical protein M409DRAFT_48496 [Zasmidium cellare ATCC 36951]|uniref:Uncharacterized protein n=1 Tax=Zasmidium cellare ATCC 36951 TaxID=1080233 RepID=A0A6A6D287_ZASCE|nr:uncharacterized protein M409DRAFT_48496 [Zasmidium cellare ATCC 36951]KAF2173534.1 hypothetical protein M409DRAFT_48496 [Zasmidium cellare ATCC 36951]
MPEWTRHSSGDVCARTSETMEGVDLVKGKKWPQSMSSTSTKLQTPHHVLDTHQELYQAYLNKIIQSAQKSHGEQLLKFEGEKGASINFKLLLEHAMAGMKQDREAFTTEEFDEAIRGCKVKSPIVGTPNMPSMPKMVASRDCKAQRPPGLAATHPSSYTQQIQHAQKTIPFSPAPKKIKLEPGIKSEPKPEPTPRKPQPFWEQIHDPKYLTSRETLDNPMYRHLSSDTMPDEPKVISPTFMIALPLGTLIEGANYWSTKDQQPRDPPNA